MARLKDRMDVIRRAFQEFLLLPSLIIILFLLLAVGAYMFERSEMTLYSPLRDFLEERIFASPQATNELLSTIAGSIITVTSITITLMLLILQQTASTMSTQVFDQFLRRRSNQFYFGFFIGLALYTLITLATVDEPFNPVFAAGLAYILTVVTLYMLILLFYGTIYQMRPPVIIQAIHDHTLVAREHQQELLARTRRVPQFQAPYTYQVFSTSHGFVTAILMHQLAEIVNATDRACEIVLAVSVGSFVAYNDLIAEVKLTRANGIEDLEERLRGAIYLERSRNLNHDPAFGITQLENIAWTATSTAKSNPTPGMQVVYSLRDLLARWSVQPPPPEHDPLPVVYNDSLRGDLLGAFESLAVVAAESKEHQIITEILNALSTQYHHLPEEWIGLVEETLVRILPTLEQHTLTRNLEAAVIQMITVLGEAGQADLAHRTRATLLQMQARMFGTRSLP